MTVLQLLKSALALAGRNLGATSAPAMTGYQLLGDAVALAGKSLASLSSPGVPGAALLDDALGLLGVDGADAGDYATRALSSVNRLLVDLFELNNAALEANGQPALSSLPTAASLATALPYQGEIVKNVMAYGLARDLGLTENSANNAYLAGAYDAAKARYTVCFTGRVGKVALAGINAMLADLFAVNNDILAINGQGAMPSIPVMSALSATIPYQNELARGVMVYGLAHALGLGESAGRDRRFQDAYEAGKERFAVCRSGNIAETVLCSVNTMLADLFDVNNALLESRGDGPLAGMPEVAALGDQISYDGRLARNVMPYGLARDIGRAENNPAAERYALAYDENKRKNSVCVVATITDHYADSEGD